MVTHVGRNKPLDSVLKVNVKAKAAKGGMWFAATSFVGQGISWIFTFYVIRLLNPEDFGLMSMASLLTAYLQMFSELGIGAAIIQRPDVNQKSLSSVFWVALGVGVIMGVAAFGLAYPTSWVFSESRLVPVTQLISILFVINALSTVPYHLLSRQFEFKKLGLVDIVSMTLASVISLYLALNGYGVYALIWTNIAMAATKMVLLYVASRWRPSLHFSYQEVKPFMGYGIVMAFSGTAQRLFETLDRLVIGRFFGAEQLGAYGSAMNIANMPLDKIWPIFRQILFPLFSRMRDEKEGAISIYLSTLTHYLLIVSPIYLGGAILSHDLILVVLGEKWIGMAPLFQIFCLVKFFHVLAAYHTMLENTSGRHRAALLFNMATAFLVPAAMWVCARQSFSASISVWYTVYPLLCVAWLVWGTQKNGISFRVYTAALFKGGISAFVMSLVLIVFRESEFSMYFASNIEKLAVQIGVGALVYLLFVFFFQRQLVVGAYRALRQR
jgi:O-antigen/teichoic acid export membrane protein